MKLLTRWDRDKITTICISFPNTYFQITKKNNCNLFLRVRLIIKQNGFRQWLGTEKTLSHYLNQWWSRQMVHIWVSRIDWVDYFTVKFIHAKKNGTVLTHDGYLHHHIWKWAIPNAQVGSGRGTGWPYFVKSPVSTQEQMCNREGRFTSCGVKLRVSGCILPRDLRWGSRWIYEL